MSADQIKELFESNWEEFTSNGISVEFTANEKLLAEVFFNRGVREAFTKKEPA